MRQAKSLLVLGLMLVACGAAAPAMSQGAESEALRQADDGTFASADLNSDGKITRGENIHFTDLVFLSMDANDDEMLTQAEFLAWDTGYVYAAEKMGKAAAVNQAKKDIFKALDLNQDGSVDHDEMSAASLYFFYRADIDRDRVLNKEEFTKQDVILKTLRAALE